MSLLDKIGNFTAKKIVAPAMILGAGLGLYQQGNAQETIQFPKKYTVPGDFNSDGMDDMLLINYQPSKKLIEIFTILQKSDGNYHRLSENIRGPPTNIKMEENMRELNFIVADVNNDNKDDLLITMSNSHESQTYTILQKSDGNYHRLSENIRGPPTIIYYD